MSIQVFKNSYAKQVNSVRVLSKESLPEGVECLLVPCCSYADYGELPSVVEFQGKMYGITGWNSDRDVAYYRTDAHFAHSSG